MTAEANDPEGPVILERFRLLRQLGEGGMGTVYYAEHVHLGSKHAVKALKPMGGLSDDLQKQMEARFLREAKVCASVKHPNLVAVTDFGASEGTLYLVMDFIDGEDLQEVISREGGLSEEMSLRILRDVAAAVGALHAQGVIHRDLKPPNVMIEKATGRVVLTDLGIAKDLEAAGTQQMTQGILGTPAYMAPEQMVDTAKTSFETDVYALGATFYAMVSCKDPFEGDNPLVVLQKAREQLFAYASLGGVAEKRDKLALSPPVLELLKAMTMYERRKRISSCDDVAARIDGILAAAGQGVWAGTGQLPPGAAVTPGPQRAARTGAAASGEPVQAAQAASGDDMTLFDMDMLQVDPNAPAVPPPAAAATPGGGLTAGRSPGDAAPAGAGAGGGLTMGRRPPSSGAGAAAPGAGLGTAASLVRKPPAGGPGGATPATLPHAEERAAGAGGGANAGRRSALAALSGEATARKPQRSFAAVWVLLLLVAAGGGGGGFYFYQHVYLPKQREKEGVEPVRPEPVPEPTPAVTPEDVDVTEPDVPVTPPPEAPPFDETKAPRRLEVPLPGGPSPGSPTMEFVIVPSGKFTIGSADKKNKHERPRRPVEFTRPFYIGRFEVTVAEFAAWLNDSLKRGGQRGADDMDLDGIGIEKAEGRYEPFPDLARFPVRSVSHEEARAFCRWMSKKTGLKVELPGEVEWEYAARGPVSPVYPWGNEWDDALCNTGEQPDAACVGSFPDGASWCGAEDMAGNVFEWCADSYEGNRYRRLPTEDPEVLGKGSSRGVRVLKGGSFGNDAFICRAAYRNGMTGTARDAALGFRVKARATNDVTKHAADR